MEKKYIIKLEENEIAYKTVNSNGCPMIGLLHPVPYAEPDLNAIRKEAYDKGCETAKHECEQCRKVRADAEQELAEKAYQRGLNDAWAVARKIALDKEDGGLDTVAYCETFGYGKGFGAVLKTFTATEAIEKIRQYEQKKEEQITKGDVVRMKSAPEIEILVTYADEVYFSGIALTEVDGNCEIGDQYTDIVIHKVEKTGRHYEIAEVLQKMKESDNG